MKLLTFAVPCYNSEAYMEKCVESLLVGGDEVEILIVDDGSKDGTAEIADRLEAEHPTIIRAIHQPNKGHGGAVNTGMEHATGLYFKVVDSDDKLRASALQTVLDTLRGFVSADGEATLDLLISNFVYDKEGQKNKRVMEYRRILPVGRVFTWEEAGRFRKGHYILMHSVIYRTKMLQDNGFRLPEHTFYVDNLYVFEPLSYVKKMYYLDVNLYYYFIGRNDQSVNETVMISRLDQQQRVNNLMTDFLTDPAHKERIAQCEPLYRYMCSDLEIICTITSVLALRSNTPEHLEIKKQVWDHLKERDEALYRKLRTGFFGIAMHPAGPLGRQATLTAYKAAQKIFGFN